VLGLTSIASAQDDDPLALASLLLSNGSWDRAQSVLQDIDPEQRGLDTVRYHSLSGLVALQQRSYPSASAHFEAAIAATHAAEEAPDPTLFLYLSRAQLLGGEPAAALRTLDAGGEPVNAIPSSYLIRARAHRDVGDLAGAFDAYSTGAARFPLQRDFPRQQILLLVEMGLTQEASARAAGLLEEADASAEDALTVAEALRKTGAVARAATILEAARLRFPEEPEILVQQAVVAMTADQPLTAARFLQVAAEFDSEYALKSAELYRQANQLESALYMNAQVTEPVEKVRQRFGLLLSAESYERAVVLGPRLQRLNLTSEDDVAYGLAYALFMTGDLEQAEALLTGIGDPELFTKATALRQAMARCKESPESCG
jgi:thioredoxin-like negative regulator of GroEL